MNTKLSPLRTDLGLFLMRAMVGVVFLFHGAGKVFGWFGGHGIEGTAGWMESIGMPLPLASATAAGLTELLGGLALVSGFGMRLAAIPLTFTMLVAASVHTGFNAANGGMEYPLTLAVLTAGLGLVGPGRFALRLPRATSPSLATASAVS